MSLDVLSRVPAVQEKLCATCNYAERVRDSSLFKCTNPETKHPPFEHPIIFVRGSDPACEKHWERHAAVEVNAVPKARWQDDADQRILKLGAAALLSLFVLAIFRDKLGDVFPALRTYFPWLF